MTEDIADNDFNLFPEICLNSDSDSECNVNIIWKPPMPVPIPPPEPFEPLSTKAEKYVDFEKYIRERCKNRIKILDRSTFHQIERPIILAFNHFREKCYYHTQWLDRFYEISLKYGQQIEFIMADQIDIDIVYPHTNPINFFSYLVRPEDERPTLYAIDKNKQIYEHFDVYYTVDNLLGLCENLLNGSLCISQPIPERTETLVKVCVHLNYNEMVNNSTKNIFLIVGLGDYRPYEGYEQNYEPNYEQIAKDLQDANLDLVYIDGGKNYVPFEFYVNCYPTLIFIPHNDKGKFIRYDRGPRDTANLMDFIKENMAPQAESWRHKELMKLQYKPFNLPRETELHFDDLNQYINENFPKSLKVLDPNTFRSLSACILIHFLDFRGKGVRFYIETLQRIYQVAEAKYGYGIEYLIADLQDIDVLYPNWYKKYMQDLVIDNNRPQIYAIDQKKRIYKLNEFKTPSSLFFVSYHLTYNLDFYYSQPRVLSIRINNNERTKTCVADTLESCIEQSKTDIFLTIYRSTYRESFKILTVLEEIAHEADFLNVKLLKMDAKLNYVHLEYSHSSYPVHFFIPHKDKKNKETIRYISLHQRKEELLEFIRTNAQ